MELDNKYELAKLKVEEWMKPIYGFVVSRTKNLQDAEDLSQEICIKVYKAIVAKDDIDAIDKYIWTIAHNTLTNFYRKKATTFIGIEGLDNKLVSDKPLPEDLIVLTESIHELQCVIAYLSKTQREVVIQYYYLEKKQKDIAKALGIPLGTVKWHLSDAKQQLKKGMNMMRNTQELKFNPIKFDFVAMAGNPGAEGGPNQYVRSTLSQNILYYCYRDVRTVAEIAKCLNVSPVFIEDEVARLVENDLLIQKGHTYLSNLIIDEGSQTIFDKQHEMYETAAELVGNALVKRLLQDDIVNGGTLGGKALYIPKGDKNFALWSLVPYILSNTRVLDKTTISFEEVATIRPDGGVYIAHAIVKKDEKTVPVYYEEIKKSFGPIWNSRDNWTFWMINNEWTNRDFDINSFVELNQYYIELLEKFLSEVMLTQEEYTTLLSKGLIRRSATAYELGMIQIPNKEILNHLLQIGEEVKKEYAGVLGELKEAYIERVLTTTPKHLKKTQRFLLQQIFGSDGYFMLYCFKYLVQTNQLVLPKEEQRKTLIMLLAPIRA